MKKEKTIRTYQRRTKTGKVVTVKQHTAKYDAAEALKEAAKKKGAGDELEKRRMKPQKEKNKVSPFDMDIENDKQLEWAKKYLSEGTLSEANERKLQKAVKKYEKSLQSASKAKTPKVSKVEKATKGDSSYGFTADDYKAWYHWDQDADPKNKSALKVEKALKKQMGAKGYKKYFDEMSDSYSSRGHNKAFKGLSEKFSTGDSKKSVTPAKETKSKEDDWRTAPKNSGKYRAGKQKEGAAKEGLHYDLPKETKEPSKKLLNITNVKDKKLQAKITKKVEAITDGEYSEKPYTWKDVLTAARHPAEKSVHAYLERMGIRVPRFTEGTSTAKSKESSSKKTTDGNIGDLNHPTEWSRSMQKKYSGSTGRDAEVSSLLGVSHSLRLAPTGYTKGAIQTAIRELKKVGGTKQVKSLEKLLTQKEKSKSKTPKAPKSSKSKDSKISGAKAKEVLGQLKSSDVDKAREVIAKHEKQQAAEKRKAGKQKIAQLKEKGYALVRTGATGSYYAKKGSRTVYNPDGTKAMPSQAEYALAKLAGRKPRRLR